MKAQGNSLFEVHCIKCGEVDVFVGEAPPKFVCKNCVEKERNKE